MIKFIQLTLPGSTEDGSVYVNIDKIEYFGPEHNDIVGDYTSIRMGNGDVIAVKETAEEIFEAIKDFNVTDFLFRK